MPWQTIESMLGLFKLSSYASPSTATSAPPYFKLWRTTERLSVLYANEDLALPGRIIGTNRFG
jgi:hypothetical protein